MRAPARAAEPERSGRERSRPDRCRPRRTPTERGTRGVRERACGGVPDSLGCVPAVDRERDAGYEACASAAEPEHGRGHLAGLSESRDRLVGYRLVHVELAFGEHVRDHRRSIVPGQIALIRMPRGAYSSAALFERPRTPCLEAW